MLLGGDFIKSNDFELYHKYLFKKSLLGELYRKYYLYPKIHGFLKQGVTLDIGCGVGDFVTYISNRGSEVIGCDINPLNVHYLAQNGYNSFTIIDDDLLLQDKFVENVVMDNVLEHILNPLKILNEVYRVLSPSGLIIIGVSGIKGFEGELDHKVFYDLDSLKLLLRPLGFKCTNYFYTPIKSSFLDRNLKQYCLYAIFEKCKIILLS